VNDKCLTAKSTAVQEFLLLPVLAKIGLMVSG